MAKEPEFIILEDQPGLQAWAKKAGLGFEVFNYSEGKGAVKQKRIKIYLGSISQAFRVGMNFGLWYSQQLAGKN